MIDTFLPILHIGAAKGDWSDVAKEYSKDIGDRLKPEPEVIALAHKLTASLETNLEKIRVLARHIQKEITYQGLEFGRRARRPNPASQVISSHYGDCKDQALLLHLLLAAVDIKSHLALVSTEHDIIPGLPTLDQFNHMIVHVPELPCGFIDTTGINNPAGYLPPDLYATQALVLDPQEPRLVGFPETAGTPKNEVRIDRQVTFDDAGAARVTETVNVTGYYGGELRNYLSGKPEEQRLAVIQSILQENTRAQLDGLKVSGMDDVGGILSLTLEYRVPTGSESRQIPTAFEESILGVTYDKSRHHPFQYFHGMKFESRTRLLGAPPLDASRLADFKGQTDSSYLKWQLYTDAPDTIVFKATRPTGRFKASEYAASYGAARTALDALKAPLR